MAITSLDIKFRQSQRMTDFDDGGGRMSATEILDNAMNNVFSDRSDLDGIIGRVSLRKLFLETHTANVDTLLGPFAFLTDPPADPKVSVCLFNTASSTDTRTAARGYVEAYRIDGVKSQFTLYGDHFAGQRTVQVYCRAEIASPDIGDVLCLSVEASGYTPAKQFVAVEAVASRQTLTFTDGTGDFLRDVLVIKITSPLQQLFKGMQDPQRIVNPAVTSPTIIRNTQVADAARYYGMKPCTVAPQIGDLVVKVGDPYVPIVPSTQAETPLVDQLAGLGARAFVKCSAANALTFSGTMTGSANTPVARYFGTPYAPGTLAITVGTVALRDDGSGGVVAVSPTDTGWSGEANYSLGMFSIARDVGYGGSVTATATAAGLVTSQGDSRSIPISGANRNISHVFQLPGQPSPGSVTFDYLTLGKWIRLTDTGRGQLSGNPGEGSATINYASGSVAVTLGALPDIDSALIVSWASDLRARNSSGEITIPTPSFRQQLAHPGALPGTLVITWKSGGITKTASAVSAGGALTGDAAGCIDLTTGLLEFVTTFALDPGEQFHYAYSYVDPSKQHSEVVTPSVAGHTATFTLAHPPKKNSIVAQWTVFAAQQNGGDSWQRSYCVIDNGLGGFDHSLSGTNSVDYSTGAIILTVDN